MSEPEIRQGWAEGFRYTHHVQLGLLSVAHRGSINWDHLQRIKSLVWGPDARAIEVYPADAEIVNGACERHLWRLGAGEFCPDLLGRYTNDRGSWHDTLEARFGRAWEEADAVFEEAAG